MERGDNRRDHNGLHDDASAPLTREPRLAGRADQRDRGAIAAEVLQLLEERGVPGGAWLVDIGRVRRSLQDADTLLRRLEDAIIRTASEGPPAA